MTGSRERFRESGPQKIKGAGRSSEKAKFGGGNPSLVSAPGGTHGFELSHDFLRPLD